MWCRNALDEGHLPNCSAQSGMVAATSGTTRRDERHRNPRNPALPACFRARKPPIIYLAVGCHLPDGRRAGSHRPELPVRCVGPRQEGWCDPLNTDRCEPDCPFVGLTLSAQNPKSRNAPRRSVTWLVPVPTAAGTRKSRIRTSCRSGRSAMR
jgi:hypothetical protein